MNNRFIFPLRKEKKSVSWKGERIINEEGKTFFIVKITHVKVFFILIYIRLK